MSGNRLFLTAMGLAAAVSAGAANVHAQVPRPSRPSPKHELQIRPSTVGYGSFAPSRTESSGAASRPSPNVEEGTQEIPPSIVVTSVTADPRPLSEVPVEPPDEERTAELQSVGNSTETFAKSVPHAFVDVHPDLPADTGHPPSRRSNVKDASWAAALDQLDNPSSEPLWKGRMASREMRGAVEPSPMPLRELPEWNEGPIPENRVGLVAWVIGGSAGMAILVVLSSILIRAVRGILRRRKVFENAPTELSAAITATELSPPPKPVVIAAHSPIGATKTGRLSTRLGRKHRKPKSAVDSPVTAPQVSVAKPVVLDAPKVNAAVESRKEDIAPRPSPLRRSNEGVHAHRAPELPRNNRPKSAVAVTAMPGDVVREIASPVMKVEEKAVPLSASAGTFARALAQLQLRSRAT